MVPRGLRTIDPPPARPGCCCSSWAGAVTAVQQPVTTTNCSGADTDRGHALAAPGHVRHVLARVPDPWCCPVQLCNVQCASVCTSLTRLPLYLVWSPSVRVLGLVCLGLAHSVPAQCQCVVKLALLNTLFLVNMNEGIFVTISLFIA